LEKKKYKKELLELKKVNNVAVNNEQFEQLIIQQDNIIMVQNDNEILHGRIQIKLYNFIKN